MNDEPECSGVAASWCPSCGDCTCPREDDGEPVVLTAEPATIERMWPKTYVVHNPSCPLHGTASTHGALPRRGQESDGRAMRLAPITCRRATALGFVARVHRRLPRVQGAMWGVSLVDGERVVGVVLVGHPSRVQTSPTNEHLRVLRLAVEDGVRNGCSMLYVAAWRAARAMGCRRMDTHTHLDEPGTSLVAAGWLDGGLTDGGEHSRPSRRRAPAVDSERKRRWWAPGSVDNDGRKLGASKRAMGT